MKKILFLLCLSLLCMVCFGCNGVNKVKNQTSGLNVNDELNTAFIKVDDAKLSLIEGDNGELDSLDNENQNENDSNNSVERIIDNIVETDDLELVKFMNNIDDEKFTPVTNNYHGYPISISFKNGITKILVNVSNGSLELYDFVTSKETECSEISWYVDSEKEKNNEGYTTYISIVFENNEYILGYAVLKIDYICDSSNGICYYTGTVKKSTLFLDVNENKQNITYEQVLELIKIQEKDCD